MLKKLACCLAAFAAVCPVAYAETENVTLPPIVVTASAEPVARKNAVANVQVVTRQEIAKSGSASLPQLLQKYSSAYVADQPGNFSQIRIRGFSGNKTLSSLTDQVLLLIDGNRSGTGNIGMIPLSAIDRIEILRGPASVLYGGSAVGGVINLITRRGEGDIKGFVDAAGGSHGAFRTQASVSGSLDENRWGYSVAGQADGMQDYKSGNGDKIDNTHYRKSGGMAAVTYRPEENTSINVTGIVNAVYDIGSPGMASYPTPDDSSRSNYGYGGLGFQTTTDAGYSLKADFYVNNYVYKFNDRTWGFIYTGTDNMTTGGKLVAGIPLGEFGGVSLGRFALGTEYAHTRMMYHGTSVYEPNSSMEMLSVFAQHLLEYETLTFQYGVRYDTYSAKTKSNDRLQAKSHTKDFDHLTASAGGVWWFLDGLGLQASLGTAFVPPSTMQLAGEYEMHYTGSTTKYHPNPDLRAEKSITGAVGLEFDKYGIVGSAGYFTTHFKDRIITEYSGGWPTTEARYTNSGKQYASGLEGDLRYSIPFVVYELPAAFSTYFHGEYFTEQTGRNVKGDPSHKLLNLPEYKATIGLGLEVGMVRLDVNGQFFGEQTTKDFSVFPSAYTKVSSFALYNARLAVTPWQDLSFYLDLENLEDKQYEYVLDYPMPGRTVMAGVRYEF